MLQLRLEKSHLREVFEEEEGVMAKRFTDTGKWADPWFCGLTNQEKLFWIYLLDTCDLAGIWKVNWPLVSFYVPGFEFKEASFKGRIQILSEEKWWVRKFTDFQYGELQPEKNRLHQRVIYELQKEGVSTPLKYPSQGVQDKDREKKVVSSAVKKGGVGGNATAFDQFWKAYPKKRSKGDAEKAWREHNPTGELNSQIMRALESAKTSSDWVKDGGQYIPYPASWLNAKGWEDVYNGGPNAGKPTIHDRILDGTFERSNEPRGGMGEVPAMFKGVDKT